MTSPLPLRTESDLPVRAAWSLLIVVVGAALGAALALHSVPTIAIAAGIVFAILLLSRPHAATPLALGLIYSNAMIVAAQFHGLPYVIPALLPIMLLVPIAYRLLVQRKPVIITRALPLVLLYLVVHLVSAIASGDTTNSMNELVLFITQGLLLYLAVTNAVHSLDTVRLVVWTLLAVGTLLAGLSVVQEITRDYDNDFLGFAQTGDRGLPLEAAATADGIAGRQPRASGSLGETNFHAQLLIVLVPLALFRFWGERTPLLRTAAIAAAAVITLGVILTFSRGAALGFVVLAVSLLALRYVSGRQLAVVLLGAVVVFGSMPAYLERLTSLEGISEATAGPGEADTDPVIQQRANDVLAAMLVFVENPVLGVGPGRFPTVYQEYAPRVGGIAGSRGMAAHSLVPEVAAETGMLGLLVFGGVFVVTMRDLAQARTRLLELKPEVANLAASFLVALLVWLGTSVALHLSYPRYFWTLMALAGVTGYLARRETPSRPVR